MVSMRLQINYFKEPSDYNVLINITKKGREKKVFKMCTNSLCFLPRGPTCDACTAQVKMF